MSTIKKRWAAGEFLRICGIGRMPHHNLIHILGMSGGFHGVWFDLEHVGFSSKELEILTMAAREHGMDTFCRVAPTDYATVTRCFEAGSSGVMAAQINSAAQAEEFVQWSKFHPRGWRGLNTGGWDAKFTMQPVIEFTKRANEETLVIIQIETVASLEQCEAIAAIDGVDGLFVGPSDLSQSLGVTGQFFHDKCLAAIERVSQACRNAGKPWSAVTFNAEHAQMLMSKGCTMLSPANDIKLAVAGVNSIKQSFADVFAKAK